MRGGWQVLKFVRLALLCERCLCADASLRNWTSPRRTTASFTRYVACAAAVFCATESFKVLVHKDSAQTLTSRRFTSHYTVAGCLQELQREAESLVGSPDDTVCPNLRTSTVRSPLRISFHDR